MKLSYLQKINKKNESFIKAARLQEPSAEESFLDLFKKDINI